MIKLPTCILICGILSLVACSKTGPSIDVSLLNYEKPFGLTWDMTELPIKKTETTCSYYIKKLENFFTSEEKINAGEACIAEQYLTTFISKDRLPTLPTKGSVGIISKGGVEPILVSYSYLHDLDIDIKESKRNSKLRKNHAGEIKAALRGLYGQPVAKGYFDEAQPPGFFIRNSPLQPCYYWLKNNIGIFLCSERVIYLDGYEMSLSFVRLDRLPEGKNLYRELSGNKLKTLSATLEEENPSNPTAISMLQALSELVDTNDFRQCKSNHTQPLEKARILSEAEQATFSGALQQYSGDNLAIYAIEYYNNRSDNVANDSRDRITVFLLKHAVEQESAIALNEIGNALLSCNFNVQQDVERAHKYLTRASNGGDAHAKYNLARMNIWEMTNSTNPRLEAKKLLRECSNTIESCSKQFSALEKLTSP